MSEKFGYIVTPFINKVTFDVVLLIYLSVFQVFIKQTKDLVLKLNS